MALKLNLKKDELISVAVEMGLEIPSKAKIIDLKKLIESSAVYKNDIEFVRNLVENALEKTKQEAEKNERVAEIQLEKIKLSQIEKQLELAKVIKESEKNSQSLESGEPSSITDKLESLGLESKQMGEIDCRRLALGGKRESRRMFRGRNQNKLCSMQGLKECRSEKKNFCLRPHNSLIHFSRDKTRNPTPTSNLNLDASTFVPEQIEGLVEANSQSQFVATGACAEKLQLKMEKINTVVSRVNDASMVVKNCVKTSVANKAKTFESELMLLVVNKITDLIPNKVIDVDVNVSEFVPLADDKFNIPDRIDMLLGAEIFYELLKPGKFYCDNSHLVLQNTVFGYVEELGHLERVVESSESPTHYYIPHHGVLCPEKLTTNLRIVFNGSSPTTTGISLNDILLKGEVKEDVFETISRFRRHKFAFTTDIQKMYRQILINPDQQDLQRIIWKHGLDAEILTYRLKTVTYGLSNAPFLAIRTLQQLAKDEKSRFPLASETLLYDTYMDDIVSGAPDLETAQQLQSQLKDALQSCGMNLHKWSSNSPELLNSSLSSDVEHSFYTDIDLSVKTLGISWKPFEDCFVFKQLWQCKLYWDDVLPNSIANEWREFVTTFKCIEEVKINRFIMADNNVRIVLQGFADASEAVYGAVVSLQCFLHNAAAKVSILASKSRVAPIRVISIPRLELCACVLLAQLVKKIRSTLRLNISDIVLHTDSTIALASDGLLRVGGRLSNSDLPYVNKHPAILQVNHNLTVQIIAHFHRKNLHTGASSLLHYLMGNLPLDRVAPDYPFNCSAIHIEIVSHLTSDAFIATLKRFFSRRGKCAKLYSDNGKSFLGANKELKRFLKLIEDSDDNLAGFLSAEGIEWKFIYHLERHPLVVFGKLRLSQ
ncbi:integrase catalytic domain-containing protein [Trichonephila clavipes]|uniref:Integrase catalytic domain-containing protein n=1 Tax=Trichonephila clavipes TaxID=2585209 RepID=A0A8X6W0A8_TRICX|nr:integrase catalytic domain-containing protein [Trichonephila clavipes]